MRLYFANHRAVWRVGDVAGVDRALLEDALPCCWAACGPGPSLPARSSPIRQAAAVTST